MYNKQEVLELLNSKNVEFEMVEHEAVFTMEDMDNLKLGEKGTEVKNLFLRDEKGKNHFLVVAKEDTKIDLKTLKDKINSTKLSFASEERLQKYLGVTKGCVSPFGVLNDEEKEVKVFIDKNVEIEAKIAVHPNDNTATVYIATKDVENIIKEHGNSVEYITL
ncbi:MAG: prolyl-tRNA synthetase associated domain-containing protein [Clostridia bacterium]|nr:prolyl-tRNA synthetase associated domain-containing protein [Clostridia bacterium]